MNSLLAFSMGERARAMGAELMVFDWDKAAQIIRDTGANYAAAGLRDDWEYTGGTIYKDGQPVKDDYTYLSSVWATPELEVNGEIIPCYKMAREVPGWDAKTKWPPSALAILQVEIVDGEKVEG